MAVSLELPGVSSLVRLPESSKVGEADIHAIYQVTSFLKRLSAVPLLLWRMEIPSSLMQGAGPSTGKSAKKRKHAEGQHGKALARMPSRKGEVFCSVTPAMLL